MTVITNLEFKELTISDYRDNLSKFVMGGTPDEDIIIWMSLTNEDNLELLNKYNLIEGDTQFGKEINNIDSLRDYFIDASRNWTEAFNIDDFMMCVSMVSRSKSVDEMGAMHGEKYIDEMIEEGGLVSAAKKTVTFINDLLEMRNGHVGTYEYAQVAGMLTRLNKEYAHIS